MKFAMWMMMAGVLAVSPAMADDAAKNAKAAELVEITNGRQMMDQMMGSMKQAMSQQMRQQAPDGVSAEKAQRMANRMFEVVQKMMSWDELKPQIVKVYADNYSESELDGILGFYKSPAGKAMVSKMPAVMQQSMMLMQGKMRDIGPEIEKMMKEEAAKP